MTDTLIEFYDGQERMNNLLGALLLRPKRVVYLCRDEETARAVRASYPKLLSDLGAQTAIDAQTIDYSDIEALPKWIEVNHARLFDYALEITGGDDFLLLMAGRASERHGCPVYGRRAGTGIYMRFDTGERVSPGALPAWTVAQRTRLYDGMVARYSRVQPEELTPGVLSVLESAFQIQKRNTSYWYRQTKCLQEQWKGVTDDALSLPLHYSACARFNINRQNHLRELAQIGLIQNLERDESGYRFTFRNALLRDALRDDGILLEVYIYGMLKRLGRFDDVKTGAVVEWADSGVINELDVLATAGLGQVFISCKVTSPDMEAVGELRVLKERFGSAYSIAILCVLPHMNAKLDTVRTRCEQSGVELVNLRDYQPAQLSDYFAVTAQRLRDMVR